MEKMIQKVFSTKYRVKNIQKEITELKQKQQEIAEFLVQKQQEMAELLINKKTEETILIERIREKTDRNIAFYYHKNLSCHLTSLFDKYGSDKGEIFKQHKPYPWESHTYSDFYAMLFDHCRMHVKNMFECGLGTNNLSIPSNMTVTGKPGASLRAWRDYFPNANIVGADIDRDVLFTEERIKTYYVDQTSPDTIKALWDAAGIEEYDIMLDDGLHTHEAGICLFENSIHKLSKSGIYFIEDIYLHDLERFLDYFADKKQYNVNYVTLARLNSSTRPYADNNILMIKHAQPFNSEHSQG